MSSFPEFAVTLRSFLMANMPQNGMALVHCDYFDEDDYAISFADLSCYSDLAGLDEDFENGPIFHLICPHDRDADDIQAVLAEFGRTHLSAEYPDSQYFQFIISNTN
jgi:hypothetical protein